MQAETTFAAAVRLAEARWEDALVIEAEHRLTCEVCPFIGFPVCATGEKLVTESIVRGEALKRVRHGEVAA